MSAAGGIVIALGGNALGGPDGDHSAVSDQAAAIARALTPLVPLFASGARVAITHGNGPQVGNLMLRSELSAAVLPPLPLDTCVADTLGGISYTIARELRNALHRAGVHREVAGIVTMTRVNDGPGALKPIGVEFPASQRADLEGRGWALVDRPGERVRRVVMSPEPGELLELHAIRALFDAGVIVVAAGGGGIPVARSADGMLSGVEAVVDKDLASALLAAGLEADTLVILTDVENVKIGYGTAAERSLLRTDVRELRALQAQGIFQSGSMWPKVEAILRFIELGGRRGVIAHLDASMQALVGTAGTEVLARIEATR